MAEEKWLQATDRIRWEKKGQIVEGILLEVKQFTFEKYPSYNYRIETSDGPFWVNGHRKINKLITERVKIGDKIKIEYKGGKGLKAIFKVFFISLTPGVRTLE